MTEKFCTQNNLDFEKNFFTSHAIINEKCVDDKKNTCGVFIDFDTEDQPLLLDKLSYYGIKSIANRWLKSYLSNRTQYVSINGLNSDHKLRKVSFPQSLVFGPLLSLILINDLNFAS